MVLPLKDFEGTKREDVITFIRRVDEIAQGACWTDKEWVLTVADLLGGRAAPCPVKAIEPVKKTSNIEELREEPAFEWILKALNGDESGCQGKTSR